MAGSEKLVLGAAGRKATTARKVRSAPQNRRSLKDLYSDDRSYSKTNDYSDGLSGKPSGLRVRVKRILDPAKRDEDHGSRQKMDESDCEHDRADNPLAIELYKDEDDWEKLSELTELQREMILAERAMERSEQEWAKNLAKWKAEYRKGSCSRPRTRETHNKAERAGALAELAKRRSDPARRQSSRQISPVNKRPLTLATHGNPSGSGSGSHDVEGELPRTSNAARRRSSRQNSAVNKRPLTQAIYGNPCRSRSGSLGESAQTSNAARRRSNCQKSPVYKRPLTLAIYGKPSESGSGSHGVEQESPQRSDAARRRSSRQNSPTNESPLTLAIYGNPSGRVSGSHGIEGELSQISDAARRGSSCQNSPVNKRPLTLAIYSNPSASGSGSNGGKQVPARRSDAARRQSCHQNSPVNKSPLTLAINGNPSGRGSGLHGVEGESSRSSDVAKRHSIGQNSAVNKRPLTLAIYGNTSWCGSGSHGVNRELPLNSRTASDSDEDDIWSKTKVPTYENIKDITIQRSTLEKWFTEPFFEQLIVGCFVRLAIGNSWSRPVYRLCPVRRVDARNPDRTYEFDNKTTYKYLNVVWGPEYTAASWPMASVSNASPTKEEFDQWFGEVKRFGGFMPTKEEVRGKMYAIQGRNILLDNVAIVPMEKKSIIRGPSSIAAEKVRLRSELETVDDVVEVERIKARLQELEVARQAERDKGAKALRLAEMNRRNRIENLRNASEKKPVNPNLKAGDPGYDPFSRRWTRSTNYYLAKSSTGGEKNDDATAAVADTGAGVTVSADPGAGTEATSGAGRSVDTSAPSAEVGAAAGAGKSVDISAPSVETEAAAGVSKPVDTSAPSAETEAAAGAGKAVDTSAPVEQGTEWYHPLHNFELKISLDALQKFGGPKGVVAGFMAGKQRTEANLGRKVPEDDGRKHDRTLTVTEYMKRRGLL